MMKPGFTIFKDGQPIKQGLEEYSTAVGEARLRLDCDVWDFSAVNSSIEFKFRIGDDGLKYTWSSDVPALVRETAEKLGLSVPEPHS